MYVRGVRVETPDGCDKWGRENLKMCERCESRSEEKTRLDGVRVKSYWGEKCEEERLGGCERCENNRHQVSVRSGEKETGWV